MRVFIGAMCVAAGASSWVALQASEQIAASSTPASDTIVTLPTFEIKDSAISSFDIGLLFITDERSGMVHQLYVNDMLPGSEAERKGIELGDRIFTLNGKKVSEYGSSLVKGSELGRIFLNRPPGAWVSLEIISWRSGLLRKVVLSVPAASETQPRRR